MTEIQNPKPICKPEKHNLSIGFKTNTIPEYCSRSFWSLNIEI